MSSNTPSTDVESTVSQFNDEADVTSAEMQPIEGQSPAPINMPSGCAYHPRCPLATEELIA
nr:hypothetical protein [Halostagnicola sp. A56]